MFLIECPFCGPRDETEFTYGGDATVKRPEGEATLDAWMDYVYMRDNPRGVHSEYWHHISGCRQWIKVERDTLTHEIFDVSLANASQKVSSPKVKSVKAKTPKAKTAKSVAPKAVAPKIKTPKIKSPKTNSKNESAA